MGSESSNPKKSDRSTGKRDHVVHIDDLKSKSDASASNSDSDKDDDISCTCRFFHYLAILGICGLVGFFIFKLDEVNYPRISITSVEVSSIKSGAASASAADIMVGFVSDNSGDDIEEYGDIRASVYYEGSLIASTLVYPFEQHPKEVTERKARMRASNIDWVSKADHNKTHHDAVLSFDITISSSHVRLPRNNIMDLTAFCDGVRVKFTGMTTAGTGSMIGGSKECRVVAENSQNH